MDIAGLPFSKDVLDRTPPEVLEFVVALCKRLEKMEAELRKAEAKIKELEHRLNLNSSNSSKPPSTDPPDQKQTKEKSKSGRRRGGQPGHPRNERPLVPPEKLKETVDCKPDTCSHCGGPLTGEDPHPECHQVAELPPVEPEVVEYRVHTLVCKRCGKATHGTLPKGVPKGAFGPRLAAILSLFSGAYRLSKRQIQQLASDLFQLTISTGMICKLERKTAEILEKPYKELAKHIQSQSANADETGWKENKKKAWLWVVVAPLATVFRIASSRARTVIVDLLGKKFGQVVGCDRAKMYLRFQWIQWCWAHLIRDFQAMVDRKGDGGEIGESLLDHAENLFAWWNELKEKKITRAAFKHRVGLLKKVFHADLERGADCKCKKSAATCRSLLAGKRNLWTFVNHEGIEPTNNAAERALRFAVIWRRISCGTDSDRGSRFVERILSVVSTCRQQGRNVLEYLVSCHQARINSEPADSLLPKNALAT